MANIDIAKATNGSITSECHISGIRIVVVVGVTIDQCAVAADTRTTEEYIITFRSERLEVRHLRAIDIESAAIGDGDITQVVVQRATTVWERKVVIGASQLDGAAV